jgi:hypothetical protein
MNAILNSTSAANPFDAWFEAVPALGGLSMMDHLYNRLDGAYPHKWRSNFPTTDAIDNWKTSWAEAFEEEDIKPGDIRNGLKACRSQYDWPPSCAEFIKACRPSVDPMVAYYEAVNGVQARARGEMGKWSHPAIFWAAMPMAFDLGQQTFSQIKVRWQHALAEQMDHQEWASIPEPMVALPAPGKGALSKEKAEQMVQQLGAALKPKTDHLIWMKRILEREKRKDKTLTAVQIEYAHRARKNLGLEI